MSKYYKAEDVEIAIADTLQFESEVCRPYKVFLDSAKDMLKNLQAIEVSEDCSDYYNGYCARHEDGCFHQCKNAPSVVPQPKEGEWIEDDDGDKKCSNCGEYAPLSFDDYYMRGGKIRQEESLLLCPYCGAKMKGEGNE